MPVNQALGVIVTSSTPIFPDHRVNEPTTTPLSILDAKVANFAPAAAFWLLPSHSSLSPSPLTASLKNALGHYPHWAGELSFVEDEKINPLDHRYRFRRLQVQYGSPSDPGVVLVLASSRRPISSLIPDTPESDVWDASQLPTSAFIPDEPLPPGINGPSAYIQVTQFPDALAIGVKLAHGLSDAHTLVRFMHIWSFVHLHPSSALPDSLAPIFNPELLDKGALGDIDREYPDDGLLHKSASLPVRRYDYWASAEGCPPFMFDSTRIPQTITVNRPLGTPMPWDEWEWQKPAGQYVVHFTGAEVHNIWSAAVAENENHLHSARLSYLDALLAFVWALINRARALDRDEREVYCITTLGMRGRLVPDTYVGSPIVLAAVKSSPSEDGLGNIASKIRKTIDAFDNDSLGALLHDFAYEDTPQRVWNGFLGKRHVIFTSWLKLGMYDVQFMENEKPLYVSSIMPLCDGVVQVMEAPGRGREGKEKWWENGVDVSLQLEKEALERSVRDPSLRKYRC
ncbi:hypothetical protein OE88DRAFT_1659297, partial [Heliocybe sulcata]